MQNLTDAIAGGLLRNSPALALRLQGAEAELAQLEAVRDVKATSILLPNIREAYLQMVDGIDQVLTYDSERGREELRGILVDRIKLIPDESGRFLWADYALGLAALLPKNTDAEIMVAGARYGRGLKLA